MWMVIVPNLRRRIEAIEKLMFPKVAVVVDQTIMDAALTAAMLRISDGLRTALKTGIEAEMAGRATTEREAAARRAFDYVYGQEYKAIAEADPVTEYERVYGQTAHESSTD
jgi:hypothetical protein